MLTPALAHAADWDPDTARILGDPTFLPLTGQIYGDFSYGYTAQTYHYNQTPFGGSGESWDKSSNLFAPNVSYGITDDISVSANLNWGNLRSTDRYVVQELVFGGPAPGFLHFVPRQERTTYLSLGADNPVLAQRGARPINGAGRLMSIFLSITRRMFLRRVMLRPMRPARWRAAASAARPKLPSAANGRCLRCAAMVN